MRFSGVTFILTFLACPALCQVATPSESQLQLKPGQLCTVEGTVVNSNTGEPVKKITVSVNSAERDLQHSAMTDERGHFILREVDPGRYFMTAAGETYPFQAYGQTAPGRRGKILSLEAGHNEKDLVFKLAPGAVIAGTVYDEDGDPVVRANVQVLRGGADSNERSPRGGGQTNDRGEYRIFGLDAGTYLVVADRQNPGEAGDEVYLPTFYPNTPDPSQASALQARPGDELSAINLIMTKARGMRVHGRVIYEGAGKTLGSYVQLIPRSTNVGSIGRNYGGQVQDEKGEFEIKGVPPGVYTAMAGGNDGKLNLMGRAPVEVGNADVENVVVVLKSPFALRGRVRSEAGDRLNLSQLRVWFQPAEIQMMGGDAAEVNADGTFVFRNLFDGSYRINVGGNPEEFYMKSARLGGSDVLASGLTLNGAQSSGTLEIEMSLGGGTISGTVLRDSQPVPGALVTLVPDPPNRKRQDLFDTKFADGLGKFTLLGLPPGDFKIFAWDSGQDVDFQDPEFVKQYEDRGKPVHVEEKRSQTVQLESISTADEAK